MMALGLIETKGLLAAIEAADAMLKAANVRLLEKNCVGSGLVTITVAGEVSAVKASIDAATASVRKLSAALFISGHVIARPDAEVARILMLLDMQGTPSSAAPTSAAPVKAAPVKETATQPVAKTAVASVTASPAGAPAAPVAAPKAETSAKPAQAKSAPAQTSIVHHDLSALKKMSVHKLRHIAKSLKGIGLSSSKIDSAVKKDLIEAIVTVYRQIEE